MVRFIQRPIVLEEHFNDGAVLPYGLTVAEVKQAMHGTYDFFHAINPLLVERGYGRLEDILLGNSFAGVLSETLVKNLSDASHTLTRNRKVGGHPDLILSGRYPGDAVLRGEDGIEVKASKTKGGWQGHNPEKGWVVIFRYIVDTLTEPVEDRHPTEFVEVLAAELETDDYRLDQRPRNRETAQQRDLQESPVRGRRETPTRDPGVTRLLVHGGREQGGLATVENSVLGYLHRQTSQHWHRLLRHFGILWIDLQAYAVVAKMLSSS
jgi:hypothetical protein